MNIKPSPGQQNSNFINGTNISINKNAWNSPNNSNNINNNNNNQRSQYNGNSSQKNNRNQTPGASTGKLKSIKRKLDQFTHN